MRPVISPLAAALLGVGVVLAAPTVMAQSQQPAPAAPSAAIPDQKLDAAAAAMKQVTDLQRDYRQKIDAAAPADKQRLASEGNAALKKAVTDHGLSVDEYNKILTVAQNDPTVRAKLMQRLTAPQQ
jgi:predicted ATPase with chaperone activity